MKNLFRIISAVILLHSTSYLTFSQTGQDFWFAAPDVSANHASFSSQTNGRPIYLNVTAEGATNITLTTASDTSFIRQIRLAQGQSFTWQLDTILPIDSIETVAANTTLPQLIQNRGIHITSDSADITAYYELDNTYNRDIFSLKGENALGRDFWVSTQRAFNNGRYRDTYSGFVVLATEDNTTVTLTNNGNNLNVLGSRDTVITLNKGQTFSYRAASIDDSLHIQGVRIQSDKDVTVTIYDDSIKKIRSTDSISCSYDIVGDQLVPANLVGREYIIIQGNIFNSLVDGGEKIFLTATQFNTIIQISDGNVIIQDTIVNPGGYYEYDITSPTTYLSSSEPVYVFHVSGTGGGGEFGGAILPAVDNCTGSNRVTVRRSLNNRDPLLINLILRNDTNSMSPRFNACTTNFRYTITNIGGTIVQGIIPNNCFNFIQNNQYAVLNTIGTQFFQTGTSLVQPGALLTLENDTAKFHVGILNGGLFNGGKYGYFSDYSQGGIDARIGASTTSQRTFKSCKLDPIFMHVEGGFYYQWVGLKDGVVSQEVTNMLSSTNSARTIFTPTGPGQYTIRVTGFGDCFDTDSSDIFIIIGDSTAVNFSPSSMQGCSPFVSTLTNKTFNDMEYRWLWRFESPEGLIEREDLPNSFSWEFPENITDTVQKHKVKLIAISPIPSCTDSVEKVFFVGPELELDFTTTPEQGDSPLDVQLNSTTKNTKTLLWQLNETQFEGNENTNIILETVHNANFTISLIGSNGICTDTVNKVVKVYGEKGSLMNQTETLDYSIEFNSVANEILLQYEVNESCLFDVAIIDLNGKVLTKERVNNHAQGIYNKSYDVGDFRGGILIVHVRLNNNVNAHKLIIR